MNNVPVMPFQIGVEGAGNNGVVAQRRSKWTKSEDGIQSGDPGAVVRQIVGR